MTVTIPNPPGVDAAGMGSVYFVPAIADPSAPSVTELTAGTPLSCALYGWATTVDQTTSTSAK